MPGRTQANGRKPRAVKPRVTTTASKRFCDSCGGSFEPDRLVEVPLKAVGRRFTLCPACLHSLGVAAGETLQEGQAPLCGVCPIVGEARCCSVCERRDKCIEENNTMCVAHPVFCDNRLQIVRGLKLREEAAGGGEGV